MLYQFNYRRMEKIFGKNWHTLEHVVLKSGAYMDLHFEKIGENTFAMAHYFEQNGDLVCDPDMEIRAYPEKQMVEALTLQNQFGYSMVYPDPENPHMINIRVRNELNSFLGMWLRNIISQGFRLTPQ